MTTPALTPQQRALIIAAAYCRPVLEALRCAEQRRADVRLAQDSYARGTRGARAAGSSDTRRDRSTGDPRRALVPGSAANHVEEWAARP